MYRKYAFFLADIAARKLSDKDVAFDLVQDVMMEVYQSKDKLQIHTTFKGYLLTSLRNRVFKYKKQQLKTLLHEDFKQEEVTNNVSDYINGRELELMLQHAVTSLPAQCQKVFVLSREYQLSHKEIAGRMGISVNTVEQHMRKALRLLRENIDYHLFWLLFAGLLSIMEKIFS